MTKKEKVLRFIRRSPTGRSFTEIQRFVVEMNGLNYDDMSYTRVWDPKTWTFVQGPLKRTWRGYWCDHLAGRDSILLALCVKGPDKRWRIK